MKGISIHADTLNALHEMQQSIAYAVRRPVLAAAERIISEQEADIFRLRYLAEAAEIVAAENIEAACSFLDNRGIKHPPLRDVTYIGEHEELARSIYPARFELFGLVLRAAMGKAEVSA